MVSVIIQFVLDIVELPSDTITAKVSTGDMMRSLAYIIREDTDISIVIVPTFRYYIKLERKGTRPFLFLRSGFGCFDGVEIAATLGHHNQIHN